MTKFETNFIFSVSNSYYIYLALGGLLGKSGSNSSGKPKKPLNLSKVTCATCRTLVGGLMSMLQRSLLPLLLKGNNDFLKRVTRSSKSGKCGCEGGWKMAWQENEERGEEEVEVEGVVVEVVDEVKWGGEWRTSVMVAMKKALTCNIQKKYIKKERNV